MNPYVELMSVTSKQALRFFFEELREVTDPSVDRYELLYNATILAHYAQVSTASAGSDIPPMGLMFVFDNFVFRTDMLDDPQIMETAASHCLLFTGFFGDQNQKRFNVDWYAGLGASFFEQASRSLPPKKARMMTTMAKHFQEWRNRQLVLSRELRDKPRLIQIKPS